MQSAASIVTPFAADAAHAAAFLREAGIDAHVHESLLALAHALDDSTGCLILVDDALVEREIEPLQEALARLPAWFDLPLIVVSRNVELAGPFVAGAFPTSGNVTYLERPLNPHSLVSAAQMALRASSRQRQVGELMAQREQEVRLRDEFLAMLAHELRNPLAPMRNALYILRNAKVQDPLVLKNTAILSRQVDHVVRLVDDLMDVARLEHGKVALKKERVDLNSVVASGVESCLQGAQDRGHHVNVRFEPRPIAVDGDVVRLEQIVCNLITNASKFSPTGSEIHVKTGIDAGFGVITVEDQGIGFDSNAAEKLFAPFLQFNSTIDRSAGGLGMGLTIVRRLAELHGGGARAFSGGRGKGARFEIRIPLADGAAVAADPQPQGEHHAGPPRRIVVVEDNPDILETMRMLLTLWGHEVASAADGPAGLALVLRERPDVALVDVGLPGMSGYDLARRIREELPTGTIRLVAITGYGQPADREMAERSGFDAHLLKPINPETLEGLLAAST